MTGPVINIEHGPWTEEDYFALGESNARVEFFDGSLVIGAALSIQHQVLSRGLATALGPAAKAARLQTHRAVNVRLRPGRIAIPDIVLTDPVDLDNLVIEARDVALISEVTSTDAATDWVTKRHYYAEAGIPRYLLLDPEPLRLSLYRLDGDKYVEEASAVPGETLLFTAPITTELDPASLDR